MAKRLVDMYEIGAGVEILLDKMWIFGVVVGHDVPGMWVQTGDGRRWFVTNGRRVRNAEGMKDEG